MRPITLAQILTYLGTLPFIYGGFALFGIAPFVERVPFDLSLGLLSYAVVILSFIAGIHWGIALQKMETGQHSGLALKLLLMSNLVALWAWFMWLFSSLLNSYSLLGLAIGFAIMLLIDWRWLELPAQRPWFWRLRWQASSIAILALTIAGLSSH